MSDWVSHEHSTPYKAITQCGILYYVNNLEYARSCFHWVYCFGVIEEVDPGPHCPSFVAMAASMSVRTFLLLRQL